MEDQNRTMDVSYKDPSLVDGTYDVSFRLSEDSEDALFRAMAQHVSADMDSGVFPVQEMHLFYRLSSQRSNHPPWIEMDDERVYDLELTEWDYHILSTVIGESLSNVLGPDGADKYSELVDVWQDITRDMQLEDELDELQEQLQQQKLITVENEQPDNGQFMCLVKDGQFKLYENDDGDAWYVCTDCGTSFTQIGDNHDCEQYR